LAKNLRIGISLFIMNVVIIGHSSFFER